MPFRKRRRQRRRKKKRMAIVPLIKRVIQNQAEKKYLSVATFTTNLLNATAFTTTLNNVVIGEAFNERIGDKIRPLLLKIRYSVVHTNANAAAQVRVYIIQALSDVFPSSLPTTSIELMPPLNLSINPYRILHDKTWDLSLGVNGNLVQKLFIKPPRMLPENTYSMANPVQGEIRLFFVTDNSTADTISALFDSRMFYTDS